MPVFIKYVSGAGILPGLRRALAGQLIIGVLPEGDSTQYQSMLRADIPCEYEDAAVVIATSGSTGAPKGVVLSAAAILAAVEATHDRLGGVGEWVCALPPHNVAGLMTLARGIVGGAGSRFTKTDLSELAAPKERSYLSVVPAQLHRALTDASLAAKLANFAAVLVGGQAIPDQLVIFAQQAGIKLVTTYGMSETCGGCVYDQIPLSGVQVNFSDERILLTGPMAFSGYRLDPECTRETLQGKTVRTQDRGAWVNNKLQVLGRVDEVVISGGVNVDLAQVQHCCDVIWGVEPAGRVIVLDIPDARWGSRIVAVSQRDISYDELLFGLEAKLEVAAIPRELRLMDSGNLQQPGKINRSALRAAWSELMKGDDGDTSTVA